LTTSNKTFTLTLTALLIALSLSLLQNAQAQNSIAFTSQDTFKIPENNASVRFAVNGTYTNATLDNGVWTFTDLTLSGSRPLGNLTFSAKNSDVTIYNFYGANVNSRRLGYIRMQIEGQGEQTLNMGYNASNPSHPSEWTIITTGSVFLAEGKNWRLLPGDTLTFWGLTGNLTIVRYDYDIAVDDGPFYQQHSVIILTAIAVAITVTVATVIKIKTKARQP
jgi:hypothetical protein